MRLVVLHLQAVLWRYKFSQLKGSSDDGKSKIKFLFQNQDSKAIEAKVTLQRTNLSCNSTDQHLHFTFTFRAFILNVNLSKVTHSKTYICQKKEKQQYISLSVQ